MMQQYLQAKEACGDAILLFRMGDFYELFHEDARVAADKLGLTLTSRDKGSNPVPMAGFPHHQLDSYLAKLIKLGFRVAVCEQVQDPATARGLVRREVTRVVSPGTVTDHELLDPRSANFLVAIMDDRPGGRRHQPLRSKRAAARDEPPLGLAWIDISTGCFAACQIPASQLIDLLTRLNPSEVLLSEGSELNLPDIGRTVVVTRQSDWSCALKHTSGLLNRHFGVSSLEGFGFRPDQPLALRAAGAIVHYLQENQPAVLDYVDQLTPWSSGSHMEIDQATWRSLEITRTLRHNQREGSLFDVIDRTVTSMGSRQLADWLAQPLTSIDAIGDRHEAVEVLLTDSRLRNELRGFLKEVCDVQRVLARVAGRRATPRDLSSIGKTLATLPILKQKLASQTAKLLAQLHTELDLCQELSARLDSTLEAECPLSAREGGFVVAGCNPQLDEYRNLAQGGKQWIARYQARIAEETGLPSLKVGFNKVFGYYVEVTHQHRDKLPAGFVRKQTLKNAERFITAELKEYEEKVLAADQKVIELEYRIFCELRDAVAGQLTPLKNNASLIARLDAIAALAELAETERYVRPQMTADPVTVIQDGRHPVLDITQPLGSFVPNSTSLDEEHGVIHLITGPNMAGKSTYIRQTALIVLLSHTGSFVPARSATIGITDRLFARVGASDELSKGQSTFMVEMSETARILRTATPRSLVILDEIGRGTSTYDGVSLAWAIVEYLHDRIGCRTLFATHYHELTRLQETLKRVANYNVAVKEWKDDIVFLHKIVAGAADRSYGIHVARLAGVPDWVNRRAAGILRQLEGDQSATGDIRTAARAGRAEIQLTLFEAPTHPLIEKIRRIDTNHVTPMSALELLQQWQDELEQDPESSLASGRPAVPVSQTPSTLPT